MTNKILKKISNTVRGLSIDSIQRANSGHPGLPMGMSDVGVVLFSKFLKFNPNNPEWFNRDRFVLSGSHGSMLLYSLLHLYGYDLSLDDLKDFRQWGSKTPGHPEYKITCGVDTTTGPLGQGLSNAVGMAFAESHLSAKYNKKDKKIINHFTYTIAGDGDLQEGVSHEVCSFAGHNKLNKLIVFYDSNNITIDGENGLSFTENVYKRFEAYNWHVQNINGHNYKDISKSIKKAKKTKKPSLIICRTIIGYGSPNLNNKSAVHGSPLGVLEVGLTKDNLGIPQDEFYISKSVLDFTRKAIIKGQKVNDKWNAKFEAYKTEYKDIATELIRSINNELPELDLPYFEQGSIATRTASGKIIDYLADNIPMLVGGSADLTPSNKTKAKKQSAYNPNNKTGQYIHYGVREFGMGAIMNGISLHGGLLPYGGTFFVFSDYMHPSIRMAALMGLQVIYVFTHDSIGLGEDGPTHQPVEHLTILRAIPNLINIRPMDANETSIAWQVALKRKTGPTSLILTRQNVPTFDRKTSGFASYNEAEKGAYVLVQDENYEIILIGTGSEIEIVLKAKKLLNKKGIKVRVVSMPSFELFEAQSNDYKKSVFPDNKRKRVAVEAGASQSWYKYVGTNGKIIGLDTFGASAAFEVLYEKFGITAEQTVIAALSILN